MRTHKNFLFGYYFLGLSTHFTGLIPFTMICVIKSVMLLIPASSADVTFLTLILMVLQHFHSLPYWIDFLTMSLIYQGMYTTDHMCLRQIMFIPCKLCVENLPLITLPSYFLIIIICCQQLIFIITYVPFTNNIFICFDHPPCYLKPFAFLTVYFQLASAILFLSLSHLRKNLIIYTKLKYFSLKGCS